MTRYGISVNRDGSTEAWDGENYVDLGSMRVDPPALAQFQAYQRAIVMESNAPYGLVRVYGGGGEPVRCDIEPFWSEVDLRWALSRQWSSLTAKRDDPQDGLYDVFYFVPDQVLRFRLVIERDES